MQSTVPRPSFPPRHDASATTKRRPRQRGPGRSSTATPRLWPTGAGAAASLPRGRRCRSGDGGVELPAEAALGIDDLTRDPRAVIRDQRADDGCDVVRAAPPAARKRGAQTLTKFGAWPSGIDGTRVDRVD